GVLMKADIEGEIRVKCYMPSCSGYGAAVHVDECSFHQAVRLDEFDTYRILKFDDLPTVPPFRIFPSIERDSGGRLLMYLKLRRDLPPKSAAINVYITIPVPKGSLSLSQELRSPDQSAELQPKNKAVHWENLTSQGVPSSPPCSSSASLQEVGPVSLSFELLKYTCTGLQIRFLRLSPIQPGPL
ncbi:unnamed protein product, partial [Coregonus sp. 'balchen']